MDETARIEAEILRLAGDRGPERSICPSEVAKALERDSQQSGWRTLLHPVRQGAIGLARAGRIDILRKGKVVAPDAVKGVIRLRIRPERP